MPEEPQENLTTSDAAGAASKTEGADSSATPTNADSPVSCAEATKQSTPGNQNAEAPEAKKPVRKPSSDDVVMEAMALGATLDQAAAHALMPGGYVRQYKETDEEYAARIAQARVSGYLDILKRLRDLDQYQGLKLLLDLCYCDEVKNMEQKSPMTNALLQTVFRQIAVKMSEDQLTRVSEIFELGRIEDNKLKAAQDGDSACQINASTKSPTVLPASSTPMALPEPQSGSAISSSSPGK